MSGPARATLVPGKEEGEGTVVAECRGLDNKLEEKARIRVQVSGCQEAGNRPGRFRRATRSRRNRWPKKTGKSRQPA